MTNDQMQQVRRVMTSFQHQENTSLLDNEILMRSTETSVRQRLPAAPHNHLSPAPELGLLTANYISQSPLQVALGLTCEPMFNRKDKSRIYIITPPALSPFCW